MSRVEGTPHKVALGFSVGVFVSFTPFMGFHFLLSLLFAWLVRGHLVAAVCGTFFGNPLTFPLMWIASFKFGDTVLRSMFSVGGGEGIFLRWPSEISFSVLQDAGLYVFGAILIGGVPLGVLFAMLCYWPARFVVRNWTYRRVTRLRGRNEFGKGTM